MVFRIEEQIGRWTLKYTAHATLAYWRIVEVIPLQVYGVPTLSCIVSKINISWMIDYSNEIIRWSTSTTMTWEIYQRS